MKRPLIFILAFFCTLHFSHTVLAQQKDGAPPTLDPYHQLLNLIQARDNKVITTNEFNQIVKARGSLALNVDIVAALLAENVPQDQLREMEEVISQLKVGPKHWTGTAAVPQPARPAKKTKAQRLAENAQKNAARADAIAKSAAQHASTTTSTATPSSSDAPATVAPSAESAPAATAAPTPASAEVAAQAQVNAMQADANAQQAQELADASTPPPLSSLFHHLSISTGAKFNSPYSVSVSDAGVGTLTKTGDTAVPFLEFSGFNRFVLKLATNELDIAKADQKTGKSSEGQTPWLSPLAHMPDLELHIGFVFNGQSHSNFTANTIAGSGDYYMNASVGFPFWRYTSADDNTAQQLTIETGGGAVTEKSFLSVHPEIFTGLGYQWRFQANDSFGFLCARVGYGFLDVPRFVPGSSKTNVVVVGGLPKFELKGQPTLGTYFSYPIGNVFLNIGANVYFRDNPAPWSITAGMTVPVDNLVGLFGVTKKEQ